MTTEDNAAMRQALIHIGFPQTAAQAFFIERKLIALMRLHFPKMKRLLLFVRLSNKRAGLMMMKASHIVSQRVKENLKLTAYMIKYQKKLSLARHFDTITLGNVCSMISICEFEEVYENHEPPPTWDVRDPTKS
jgi:adenylate kinase family enzyme